MVIMVGPTKTIFILLISITSIQIANALQFIFLLFVYTIMKNQICQAKTTNNPANIDTAPLLLSDQARYIVQFFRTLHQEITG